MITNFELDAMEEKTMAYFKVQARDLPHHDDRRQKAVDLWHGMKRENQLDATQWFY
jgi:hypothetical protein